MSQLHKKKPYENRQEKANVFKVQNKILIPLESSLKNNSKTLFDIKYDTHDNYSFMITLLTPNKIKVNTSI